MGRLSRGHVQQKTGRRVMDGQELLGALKRVSLYAGISRSAFAGLSSVYQAFSQVTTNL